MAGYRLLLIPTDPGFVPPPAAREEAKRLLREALNRAEEVSDRESVEVELFAPSEPGPIACSSCGKAVERAFWEDAVALARRKLFRNLRVTVPCCGSSLSLNDLRYERNGVGFARYALAISNPNVPELPAQLLRAVSRALGGSLRSIWMRE